MREAKDGRSGDHTDRYWKRMLTEDMHHMFGNGHYEWLQEGGFPDQQQLNIAALGGDAREPAIQKLGYPGEDRQDVRIHGKYVKGGSHGAEQSGG
eukprot:5033530-Heterocapsa_arctica.AAC.1